MKKPRITIEQVIKIAELWEESQNYKEVAKKVGVEERQIIYARSKLLKLGVLLPKKNTMVYIYRPAAEQIKNLFPKYNK